MFGDVEDVLLVFHVNGHEFIADFGCMFSVVYQTELFGFNVHLKLGIVLQPDSLAFDLLAPSVFIEAFSKEDHVGQYNFVVKLVDTVAHTVQVQSKNFIDQHFLAVLGAQIVVVALPLRWVGGGWQVRMRRDLIVVSLHAYL
jgi:hypothetical protein